MSVSKNLQEAVSLKDIAKIRDRLWTCIALDPNLTGDFPESWKYCLDNGVSEAAIYETHDGREISNEATEENFGLLCGQLCTNFSKERLSAIKEIGKELYPPLKSESSKDQTHQNNTSTNGSKRQKESSASSSEDALPVGLIIAVAAAVVVGAILLFKK
ncbi:MAG: hypothetical protein ACRC5H_05615 [Treponemataceae bacterium]